MLQQNTQTAPAYELEIVNLNPSPQLMELQRPRMELKTEVETKDVLIDQNGQVVEHIKTVSTYVPKVYSARDIEEIQVQIRIKKLGLVLQLWDHAKYLANVLLIATVCLTGWAAYAAGSGVWAAKAVIGEGLAAALTLAGQVAVGALGFYFLLTLLRARRANAGYQAAEGAIKTPEDLAAYQQQNQQHIINNYFAGNGSSAQAHIDNRSV
jgi:hypothetical protein